MQSIQEKGLDVSTCRFIPSPIFIFASVSCFIIIREDIDNPVTPLCHRNADLLKDLKGTPFIEPVVCIPVRYGLCIAL